MAADWHLEWGQVVVEGPMGMVAATISVEDLGLDPEGLEDRGVESTFAMVSMDQGRSWSVAQWTDTWPETAFISSEGDIRLVTQEDWGHSKAFTYDPTSQGWTETERRLDERWDVTEWRDGLVARDPWGETISLSSGEAEWETIDPMAIADAPYADSWLAGIHGGESGIALVIEHATHRAADEGPAPFRLDRNGYILTLEEERGVFVLSDADGEVLTAAIWDRTAEQFTRFDLVKRTITFAHPETGEDLVTFGFEEVEEEESRRFEDWLRETQHSVMTSRDGYTWRLGDIRAEQAGQVVFDVDMSDDRVFVTLGRPHTAWRPTGSGPSAYRLEVWQADLDG